MGRLLSELSAPVTHCSVNDSYGSNVNCYSVLQFSCKLSLCRGSTVNGYSVLYYGSIVNVYSVLQFNCKWLFCITVQL